MARLTIVPGGWAGGSAAVAGAAADARVVPLGETELDYTRWGTGGYLAEAEAPAGDFSTVALSYRITPSPASTLSFAASWSGSPWHGPAQVADFGTLDGADPAYGALVDLVISAESNERDGDAVDVVISSRVIAAVAGSADFLIKYGPGDAGSPTADLDGGAVSTGSPAASVRLRSRVGGTISIGWAGHVEAAGGGYFSLGVDVGLATPDDAPPSTDSPASPPDQSPNQTPAPTTEPMPEPTPSPVPTPDPSPVPTPAPVPAPAPSPAPVAINSPAVSQPQTPSAGEPIPHAGADPASPSAPAAAPGSVPIALSGASSAQPGKVVITFSGALDPASAVRKAAYHVWTAAGKQIPVRRATYDPGTHQVTLLLASSARNARAARLTVDGSSVRGRDSKPLGAVMTATLPAAPRARPKPRATLRAGGLARGLPQNPKN